ncbi:MAG: hypothetical protein IPN34_27660 [Planctomycetes bacterium]|nr:hypothetical protein [Planctomycetota bacterium]
MAQQYALVTEEQAINAAAQIAADGARQGGHGGRRPAPRIELVVGGSVAGTGRRSTTTIFVLDRNGNGSATPPRPAPPAAPQCSRSARRPFRPA